MKRKYEIAVLSRGAFARTVRIYAPKSADRAVIMHDGQNAFYDEEASFKKSWRAIDTLKSLGIKNVAVIGIDSVDATREDDYMPFPNELADFGLPPSGGKADVYMEYIEQTVIPYLDKRFGFKLYGMLGSSAGALASLYFASRGNERVKAYGLFSTPLFVSANAFKEFLQKTRFNADDHFKVYVGGSESAGEADKQGIVPDLYVNDAFTLTNALRKSGVKDISFTLENTNSHDEISWRGPERDFMSMLSKL